MKKYIMMFVATLGTTSPALAGDVSANKVTTKVTIDKSVIATVANNRSKAITVIGGVSGSGNIKVAQLTSTVSISKSVIATVANNRSTAKLVVGGVSGD